VSGLAVISENLLQLQYAGLTIGALSGLMPVGLALIYIRRRLRLQMQFGRSIDVVTGRRLIELRSNLPTGSPSPEPRRGV
jgi:hypothetical protein